jgi:GST-like protein
VQIGKGEQFTSGFVSVNPNSKIPSTIDFDGPGSQPINLFESGSIVLYLAEKYNKFLPPDPRLKTEVMNWVFWQMGGQGPMTGQFGHFFVYAPANKVETRVYGVTRYGMEVQCLLSVLNSYLCTRTYLVGEEYTVADIMCFPWANQVFVGYKHDCGIAARDFLFADQYTHVYAWIERIKQREGVQCKEDSRCVTGNMALNLGSTRRRRNKTSFVLLSNERMIFLFSIPVLLNESAGISSYSHLVN